MLHVCYHDGWRVEIKLLHSIVRPNSKKTGPGTIEGQAFYMLKGRNGVLSDMLGSYVPRKCFPVQ